MSYRPASLFLLLLIPVLGACEGEDNGQDGGADASTTDASSATDAALDEDASVDADMPALDASLADAGSGGPAYGEAGPYAVVEMTHDNPGWPAAGGASLAIHVYLPGDAVGPTPTIFFSHGYGGTDPTVYRALIDHLVSRGLIVVFTPYPTTFSGGVPLREGHSVRYRTLWAGFQEAVRIHSAAMDLTRVGFLGHSFGAGATPAMAYAGVVGEGWGSAGAFIMLMAPWYSFDISDGDNTPMPDARLGGFPDHMRAVVQVYDEDEVNDHRMAIDVFEHLTLPAARSAFHNVVANLDYPANHAVPTNAGNGVLDGLDQQAVWFVADALTDAALALDDPSGAAAVVLTGDGIAPYTTITTTPAPVQPEDFYRFGFTSLTNLRD